MDQVSDEDIFDITNQLRRDDLQELFLKLKLKHNEIENAEVSANTKSVKLQAASVFRYWRQTNGQQATRQQIIIALKACNLINDKESLETKWGLGVIQPSSRPPVRRTDEASKSDSSPPEHVQKPSAPRNHSTCMLEVFSSSAVIAVVAVAVFYVSSKNIPQDVQSSIQPGSREPGIQPSMSDVPTKTGTTTLVTDRDIQTIARDIGLKRDDFHLLYRELGLSSDIVEDAEEAAGFKTLVLKATDVLEKWRQINGKHATRDKILKALHNATLNDALRILENKWAVNSAQ